MEIISQNTIKTGFFCPFGRNQRIAEDSTNQNVKLQRKNQKFSLSARLAGIGGKYRRAGRLFLKNKANLPKGQMNVRFFVTKDYENEQCLQARKKQSQSKPIFKRRPGNLRFGPKNNDLSKKSPHFSRFRPLPRVPGQKLPPNRRQ